MSSEDIPEFDLSSVEDMVLTREPHADGEDGATPDMDTSEFFQACSALDSRFGDLDDLMDTIRARADQFMLDTSVGDAEINTFITRGHGILKRMGEDIKGLALHVNEQKALEEAEGDGYTSELRRKMELQRSLSKRYYSYLASFQNIQLDTRNYISQKVKRIIRVVNSQLSAEEVDDIMTANDGELAIKLSMITERDDLDEILEDAMDRHHAIHEITRGVQEIHQMTLDMGMLVEQQSRAIERISAHVETAKEEVAEGVNALAKANKHMKKSRGSLCCIIVIIVIAVGGFSAAGGILSALKKG
eukprot:gnl/Dysnectes_brevis/3143_a3913_1393.p1 GENE.gnl/Dysnectes_brevis/3143_a3913_1393~~gnl/Dysnectes_brevis/3143_a3913_1393.p1  ORF type:complete len:303 (+),score=132.70 gnl/Dysnectes_brevis/3143_a3913_1393:188-1096(+)